ncbi:MAG TPA: ferritin family protein [Syntrophales bacterium]|nr:ferritin family protein [Syntrophales bacterium]
MKFESLEKILLFAIEKERDAFDLYTFFSELVRDDSAGKLLRELAGQETGHRRMLEDALASGTLGSIKGRREARDLQLSDYMVVETVTPASDPHQVMLFAMKKEQESYDLYRELLLNYGDTPLGGVFSTLAAEELRHKETLESEYGTHFAQWL